MGVERILKVLSVFLLVSSINILSIAQEEKEGLLNVTASVDENAVSIGDRIKLNILAENPAGLQVMFPEKPEDLGEFTFVESKPVKSGWGRSGKIGREYILGIYTTGRHVIPPVQVMYRGSGGESWNSAQSPQVVIDVMSMLTGEDWDIRDLKGLVFPRGMLPKWLIILILVLALVVLWILRKKKKLAVEEGKPQPQSPYEIACEELRRLKAMDLPAKGQIKEYYTQLSDIIRHYLESRFSYRAPEMTTEEFLDFIKGSSELESAHKEILKDFLSGCDMVKFAKYGPTPIEMLDSFSAAERLVEQTREKEDLKEVEV
ncbi:hypothetical protein ACFL5E_02180 [Candidatus Omnitrophota bacterium]